MLDIEELARKNILFDGRYKLLKALSTEGGTADVWLAVDMNTIDSAEFSEEGTPADDVGDEHSGMLVAIKIYRPKNALDIEGEQRFRDEYKIVHNCRHTNLLQPNNFSIFEGTPYLELPYCKNGSSELMIGQPMTASEIWKYIYDVASGLSYLHACNPPIVHQDVKPANVLIDDYNHYAITDFGISSKRGGHHGYYYDEEKSGTLAYMAPERFLEGYEPVAESDIWALGATLYEILTGKVPFGEEGGKNQLNGQALAKIASGKVPSDVQKLIASCLSVLPKDRPTARQIVDIARKHLERSSAVKKIATSSAAIVIAIIAVFVLWPKKTVAERSKEEIFKEALAQLNGTSETEVRAGLATMDSLSYVDYAPAMYELAFTYGWYSDTLSLQRKRLLGISCYTSGTSKYMPISNKYNYKATELFSRILELGDTVDPALKADAAYRMACYYFNTNNVYKKDLDKAEQLLSISQKYARQANDTLLLKAIDAFERARK